MYLENEKKTERKRKQKKERKKSQNIKNQKKLDENRQIKIRRKNTEPSQNQARMHVKIQEKLGRSTVRMIQHGVTRQCVRQRLMRQIGAIHPINLGVSFSLVDCYFQNVLPLNRVQILNRFHHRIRTYLMFHLEKDKRELNEWVDQIQVDQVCTKLFKALNAFDALLEDSGYLRRCCLKNHVMLLIQENYFTHHTLQDYKYIQRTISGVALFMLHDLLCFTS